jgi:hypothetical protein
MTTEDPDRTQYEKDLETATAARIRDIVAAGLAHSQAITDAENRYSAAGEKAWLAYSEKISGARVQTVQTRDPRTLNWPTFNAVQEAKDAPQPETCHRRGRDDGRRVLRRLAEWESRAGGQH